MPCAAMKVAMGHDLAAHRLDRNDVEEYDGREITSADNGYLSDAHAEKYNENKAAKNKAAKPAPAPDAETVDAEA